MAANKLSSAASKAQAPLRTSEVYVCVRPIVRDGSDHSQGGDSVSKSLEYWTERPVTLKTAYLFSDGATCYRFPRRVHGPEAKQEDVYGGVGGPESGRPFVEGSNDAIFLAYGQTGTGIGRGLHTKVTALSGALSQPFLFAIWHFARRRRRLSLGSRTV